MIEDIHDPGLAPEHPYGDTIQLFMFLLFFGVWVLDSFLLDLIDLTGLVPLPIRLASFLPLLALGAYLGLKSSFVVFGGTRVRELVRTGVYSWVRHPMYLGGLLFFLGFAVLTLSLPSLAVWFGMFVVYDRLAAYEEERLVQEVGGEYERYREEVPKWVPGLV